MWCDTMLVSMLIVVTSRGGGSLVEEVRASRGYPFDPLGQEYYVPFYFCVGLLYHSAIVAFASVYELL